MRPFLYRASFVLLLILMLLGSRASAQPSVTEATTPVLSAWAAPPAAAVLDVQPVRVPPPPEQFRPGPLDRVSPSTAAAVAASAPVVFDTTGPASASSHPAAPRPLYDVLLVYRL